MNASNKKRKSFEEPHSSRKELINRIKKQKRRRNGEQRKGQY